MMMALTTIQVVGAVLNHFWGERAGALVEGFFGGLISSTATTASLAKKSKLDARKDTSFEVVAFLTATTAMLFEGMALLLTGSPELHFSLLLIFMGPLFTSVFLIYRRSRKIKTTKLHLTPEIFRIWPTAKLAIFIVSILAVSKFLQNTLGQKGLLYFTFLVSLFEIHGSIIANLQLHDSGFISVPLLGSLFTISIAASYLSKLFLISTLGSRALRAQIAKVTALLLTSLFLSWLIFRFQTLSYGG